MSPKISTAPHGDYLRYQYGGCRCDDCRRAYSAARKIWRAGGTVSAAGTWTDAQPVREHVLGLEAGGMNLRMIADRAGVSYSTIQNLVRGRVASGQPPSVRITTENAEQLLAVEPDSLAVNGKIHPLGARRRLRALAWLDIGQNRVAADTGLGSSTLASIASNNDLIERFTHEKLARYYETAQYRRATQGTVHLMAVRAGHAPPWAWGDRIDDPAAEPDMTIPAPAGAVVEALNRNYATTPDTREVDAEPIRAFIQRELLDRGMSLSAVRVQLGMPYATLRKLMYGMNGFPPPRSIWAKTARCVLRAKFDLPTTGRMNLVDAIGARRRVQALVWMGRKNVEIAREAGLAPAYVSGIVRGSVIQIGYLTHIALVRTYLLWRGSLGASLQARRRGIAQGYWPPMAWDHQAIDDPAGVPDMGIAVESAAEASLAQARYLFLYGATLDEASYILGADRQLVHLQAVALGFVFPESQTEQQEGIDWG